MEMLCSQHMDETLFILTSSYITETVEILNKKNSKKKKSENKHKRRRKQGNGSVGKERQGK
jgi:hypothetical protein